MGLNKILIQAMKRRESIETRVGIIHIHRDQGVRIKRIVGVPIKQQVLAVISGDRVCKKGFKVRGATVWSRPWQQLAISRLVESCCLNVPTL